MLALPQAGEESEEAMRNASFALTEQQILDETKDVTRRIGWLWAKPGMRLQACYKVMGRKKCEPLRKLTVIEIVSVRREKLRALTDDPEYGKVEVCREGFFRTPGIDGCPSAFVKFFLSHIRKDLDGNPTSPETEVTRVEFKYVK